MYRAYSFKQLKEQILSEAEVSSTKELKENLKKYYPEETFDLRCWDTWYNLKMGKACYIRHTNIREATRDKEIAEMKQRQENFSLYLNKLPGSKKVKTLSNKQLAAKMLTLI